MGIIGGWFGSSVFEDDMMQSEGRGLFTMGLSGRPTTRVGLKLWRKKTTTLNYLIRHHFCKRNTF